MKDELYLKTKGHFFLFFAEFFLAWKMCQAKNVEKIRTYILCLLTFFFFFCHLWDNVKKFGRAGQATGDNIIRRMCIACWIPKATKSLSEYAILIAFPLQQWLHVLRQWYLIRILPVFFIYSYSLQYCKSDIDKLQVSGFHRALLLSVTFINQLKHSIITIIDVKIYIIQRSKRHTLKYSNMFRIT
jgi:hypothetical protein